MKQTKYLLAIISVMSGLAAIWPPTTVHAAQSQADADTCFENWNRKILTNALLRDYRRTTCDWGTGGNCQMTETEAGETRVKCTRTAGLAPCDTNGESCGDQSGGKVIEGCGDIKTDLIKCETTVNNPIVNMVLQVVNFLAVGVGIAVVGGIIWGGMLYASSNGDSSKTKQGITTIVNAVIGLILFIFMYALINYLVPGGLFT